MTFVLHFLLSIDAISCFVFFFGATTSFDLMAGHPVAAVAATDHGVGVECR